MYLVKKRVGRQLYWYAYESARVGGQPRVVRQIYLGKAEDIVAAAEARPPKQIRSVSFGPPAAAWRMATRLGVADAVDRVAPKRGQGLSVGTYIALAAINRLVAPTSKRSFGAWYESAFLSRMLPVPPGSLTSQRFWDAMDRLDEEALASAEKILAERLRGDFGVDDALLVFDTTNFATFIDTDNRRADLARRGHSKQHRHDLRLVGLALAVSAADRVPVAHQVYAGNRPDVALFSDALDVLLDRLGELSAPRNNITLVFDAGCASAANHAAITNSGLSFVASAPPSRHPDLLAVPAEKFHPLSGDRFRGTTVFRTRAEMMGHTRTVLVTHSEDFHRKTADRLAEQVARALAKLERLAATLARGRTRKDTGALSADIAEVLKGRFLTEVVQVNVSPQPKVKLSFAVDEAALARLDAQVFGKRILFTDKDDWTCEQIVAAYRAQSEVEASFRQMKDTTLCAWSPMWHFTDQKVRVHAFYCVVALMLAALMVRQSGAASLHQLMETLEPLREVTFIWPPAGGGAGRPHIERVLTTPTSEQQRLVDLFELSDLTPS